MTRLSGGGLSTASANATYGTLARAVDNSWIPLGDSISYTSLPYVGPSWAEIFPALSGQRFRMIRNAAIGGQTAAQMLARIQADVIAYAPRYCVILAGTNDLSAGTTLTAYKVTITAMITALRAAGITPILGTIPPNNTLSYAPMINTFNDWLRIFCQAQSIPLIGFHGDLVDVTTGGFKAGYASDNAHPSAVGALVMANTALTALDRVLPPAPSILPTYGSTTAATGLNLVVNPLLRDVAPVNDVPDGWSFNGTPAGFTTTVTTDARFLGNCLKHVFTNPAAAKTLFQTIAGAGKFSVGDKLRFVCKYALDAPVGVDIGNFGVTFGCYQIGGVGSVFVANTFPNAMTGTLQGDVTITAGTTDMNVNLIANFPTVSSGTLYFGQVSVVNLTTNGLL